MRRLDILGSVRAVLRYTAARLALFGVTLGVLYLVGARSFLLVALALLVSGLVSYVALSRQRDDFSAVLNDRLQRFNRRVDADAAVEDAAVDDATAGDETVENPATRRRGDR